MKYPGTIVVSGLLWLCTIGFGAMEIMRYELTPGPHQGGAIGWPVASRIERPDREAALVMFLHPRCPCSKASVEELTRIMARKPVNLRAWVLVVRPPGCSPEWADTGIVIAARGVPGVTVLADPGGVEARRFHAVTSGFTLLYDRTGRLLFSGGITGSRGQSGENAGSDAVISRLGGGAGRNGTAVFGCSLLGSRADDREERVPCLN